MDRFTVTVFERLFWTDRTTAIILGGPDDFERLSMDQYDFAHQAYVHMREDYRRLMHRDSYKRVNGRMRQVVGAFITLEEPTKPMVEEAAKAGFYVPEAFHGQRKYPKIQILTVEALLTGKDLSLPPRVVNTHRRAPRRGKNLAGNVELIRG